MLNKATKERRKHNKTLRQLRHLIHICKRGNLQLLLSQAERYFGAQSQAMVDLVEAMELREKKQAQQALTPPLGNPAFRHVTHLPIIGVISVKHPAAD